MSLILTASAYSSRDSSRGSRRAMRLHSPLALFAVLFLVTLAGCGRAARKSSTRVPTPPRPAPAGSTETGIASWYGYPYHGRPTASGEIYDMDKLTAAHRTLPFQTWLDVTNLSNGKHVEVRVTDRGPFIDGRIIDLSRAAAREIDMLGTGTARVRLKVITPPVIATPESPPPVTAAAPPKDFGSHDEKTEEGETGPPLSSAQAGDLPRATSYTVQAGAFADQSRAEALRELLTSKLGSVYAARVAGPGGRPPYLWRVLAGRGLSLDQAKGLAEKVRKIAGAAVVVTDVSALDTTIQGLP